MPNVKALTTVANFLTSKLVKGGGQGLRQGGKILRIVANPTGKAAQKAGVTKRTAKALGWLPVGVALLTGSQTITQVDQAVDVATSKGGQNGTVWENIVEASLSGASTIAFLSAPITGQIGIYSGMALQTLASGHDSIMGTSHGESSILNVGVGRNRLLTRDDVDSGQQVSRIAFDWEIPGTGKTALEMYVDADKATGFYNNRNLAELAVAAHRNSRTDKSDVNIRTGQKLGYSNIRNVTNFTSPQFNADPKNTPRFTHEV